MLSNLVFMDTATPEIYTYRHTLSLQHARPIFEDLQSRAQRRPQRRHRLAAAQHDAVDTQPAVLLVAPHGVFERFAIPARRSVGTGEIVIAGIAEQGLRLDHVRPPVVAMPPDRTVEAEIIGAVPARIDIRAPGRIVKKCREQGAIEIGRAT